MNFQNLANLTENEFVEIKTELSEHNTLGKVLTWVRSNPKDEFLPQIVEEVITQDEYTHDVIIPFRDIFLVFDTT